MGMDLGRWAATSVEEAVRVFADAPFRWWIAGGHALELHVGYQWRTNEDFDVGISGYQASQAYRWLKDWEMYVAAAGRLLRWDGGPLRPGRSENNVWLRRSSDSPWAFDLNVGRGSEEQWIYRLDALVTRLWDTAVLRTRSGVPYLAPDLQLLFKSKDLRPKDHADAERVIPVLDKRERAFIAVHLVADHPWHRFLTTVTNG
jgi:hypothetical protein